MKICIVHDFFESRGGSEKLALFLAERYKAPIYAYHVNLEKTFSEKMTKLEIHVPKFQVPQASILKQEAAASWFSCLDLNKQYDCVISTGTWSSVYACKHNRPNIWQCLSPPRIFYDLYEYTKAQNNFFKRTAITLWKNWRVPKDQNIVKNDVDRITSISNTIQERVKKYYNKDSEVIYPPVETDKYKCKEYGDFFLVVQRMYAPKRTKMIVEAFKNMPNKNLIIVGDGPEREELEALKLPNIKFLSSGIPEYQLLDLYSRCIATIFVARDEDFGFIPVESMAAGKPCIGSNEGGVRETILNNETGVLIEPNVYNLIQAVKSTTVEKAESMKDDCIRRAKFFDIKNFYKKWDVMLK